MDRSRSWRIVASGTLTSRRASVESPPLSNAEAAGIRTRHGRRRWMEDDPFLLDVNSGLGIDSKRYGKGVHEGRFDLAY
jgi:hypothetical protein